MLQEARDVRAGNLYSGWCLKKGQLGREDDADASPGTPGKILGAPRDTMLLNQRERRDANTFYTQLR